MCFFGRNTRPSAWQWHASQVLDNVCRWFADRNVEKDLRTPASPSNLPPTHMQVQPVERPQVPLGKRPNVYFHSWQVLRIGKTDSQVSNPEHIHGDLSPTRVPVECDLLLDPRMDPTRISETGLVGTYGKPERTSQEEAQGVTWLVKTNGTIFG